MFYFFITLAGQPAAIQWAGMSLVTTAFAAIITPSPILTPANIVSSRRVSCIATPASISSIRRVGCIATLASIVSYHRIA